jgi:hypothetical protein
MPERGLSDRPKNGDFMATKKTAAAPKAPEKTAKKAPKAEAAATVSETVSVQAPVAAAVAVAPKSPAAPAIAAKAEAPVSKAAVVAPSAETIGKRAFELFVARGGMNGNAFEDWVRAERELSGKQLS